MKWSLKIGSILGIPLKVHVTFLFLLLIIFFAGRSIIGVGGVQGVIFVALIFASVVFHELSHAMVARHYGINVVDITLLPIGGVARMPTTPDDPRQEVLISAAGPAASLILAISLWFLSDLLGYGLSFWNVSIQGNLLAQLAAVNIILAIFNLIPAFPMDGGRVLRGLLALYISPLSATRIAVGIGQMLAIGLFFLGLLSMNLFMILIALFVYMGAEAEERQLGMMLPLKGVTARSAMVSDIEVLSLHETVGEVAERYCRGFQEDFPVVDERRLVGLISRDGLIDALHKRGPSSPVSEAMARDFPTATEDTPLMEILEKIQATGSKAVPILRAGEIRGLITLDQIGRYSMLCAGYACDFMASGKSGPVPARIPGA
jgi:Zn-dependent protease/CBS domain-containing protein